jgi:hypothetical protein
MPKSHVFANARSRRDLREQGTGDWLGDRGKADAREWLALHCSR